MPFGLARNIIHHPNICKGKNPVTAGRVVERTGCSLYIRNEQNPLFLTASRLLFILAQDVNIQWTRVKHSIRLFQLRAAY